jgi:hypothetical protein
VIPVQEGWYTDPWGHHDARWMSDGVPSKLVRDGKAESFDDPPDSPPTQAWVPIEPPPGSMGAADTLRADGLEAETTPSLAELNRRVNSAAITARAHPWFDARDWTRSSPAKPRPTFRKTALASGGILAGLILLLPTYLWVVQVIAALTPPPPAWSGVTSGALFAVVPLGGTYWMWRTDRRAELPFRLRLLRAEWTAGLLGGLSLLLFIGSHLAS